MALDLGYRVLTVRQSDPIQDDAFWEALLSGSDTLWENLPEASKWTKVQEVLATLRLQGFPEISPQVAEIRKAFTRLSKATPHLDDQRMVRPYSVVGTGSCASFFRNRYQAKRRDGRSAWESWHDDDLLCKAIRLRLDSGHVVTGEGVLQALSFQCQSPSVFRPLVAMYVYREFGGTGGTVWDPCAGYGGRVLGAAVAGVARYIGTDVEPETVRGNNLLIEALGKQHFKVNQARAEEFDPGRELDLVFTSPPYYDLEIYGDEAANSYAIYGSPKGWLDLFLRPILVTAFKRLKPGGKMVLNLPDKPLYGVRLDEMSRSVAKSVGFLEQETLFMPVRNPRKGTVRGEPILVWSRPV